MACLVQSSSVLDSSTGSSSWSPLYGGGNKAKLDSDAIKIIHCIYCKDCRMEKLAAEQARAAAQAGHAISADFSGASGDTPEPVPPTSPQVSLDQGSIQHTMDKNKETLKRKLMLRRSVNELVERGIYPSLKTPPAFAGQQKQLERAKTGDLLRHKIQQRPDRSELVQQHILEDTGSLDPSLVERQRLLKRARLVDGLNDKLAHRPGPLELVQGNILLSSEELSEAIKDGKVQFNKTCEGEDPNNRMRRFTFDEESASSDGIPSPSLDDSSLSDISSPNSLPSLPDLSALQKSPLNFMSAFSGKGLQLMSPPHAVLASLSPGNSSQDHTGASTSGQQVSSPKGSGVLGLSSSSNGSKTRPKKQKHKPTSKAKVIKFHEYKGPPNVVKSQSSSQSSKDSETPYHILLQQQQLFLQWQLEFKQKNMPFVVSSSNSKPASGTQAVVMAASSQSGSVGTATTMMVTSPVMSTTQTISSQPLVAPLQSIQSHPTVMHSSVSLPAAPPPPPPPPPPPLPSSQQPQPVNTVPVTSTPLRPVPNQGTKANPVSVAALSMPKITVNLEDLKVADLKAELKKRNLPVSGSKPQLIERLKPYTEVSAGGTPNSNMNILALSPSGSKNPSPSPPVPTPTPTPPPALLHIKKEPGSECAMQTCTISPPAISTSFASLIRTAVKEEPMATGGNSPPESPPMVESSTTPMSPDIYDMASPPALTFSSSLLGSPQLCTASSTMTAVNTTIGSTAQPMVLDQSRPPSTRTSDTLEGLGPMDVEPVDLGSSLSDFKTIALPISQLNANLHKPQLTPAQQQQQQITASTALLQLEQLQQLQAQLQMQQAQVQAHMQQAQKQVHVQQQPQALSVQVQAQLNGQPQVLQVHAQSQAQPQSLISQPQVQIPAATVSLASVAPSLQSQLTTATLQSLGINLGTSASGTSSGMSTSGSMNFTPHAVESDDVVKAQAKQIEELQRQLQESQIKLQMHILQQQQQQYLLQQQQQLQGQPLLQVHLPQTSTQSSPPSLIAQRQLVSPAGHPIIAQPQLSPQPQVELSTALQQQQTTQQQAASAQTSTTLLNTMQINLANSALNVPATGSKDVKMQTLTSATGTTPSVINSVCLAQGSNPSTMKKIQIPTNFLQQTPQQQQQQHQQQGGQSTSPVIITSAIGESSNKLTGKPSLNEFLKNQVLNQGLHKSLSYPATSLATANNANMPFIFTAGPAKLAASMNGINQPGRTVSMPGAPSEDQKLQVSRTVPNPFFSIPLKEPPKYDEAVRSKQQQQHSPVILNNAVSTGSDGSGSSIVTGSAPVQSHLTSLKCQAMDDVLEILIRNGDLPPSAAEEPLPTPKTTEAQPLPSLPTSTVSQGTPISLSVAMSLAPGTFSVPVSSLPSAPVSSPSSGSISQQLQVTPSSPTSVSMTVSETLVDSAHQLNTKTFASDTSSPLVTVLPSVPDQRINLSSELLDLTEMLSGDLNAMEWTSDSGFVGLDLNEASMHLGSSNTVGFGLADTSQTCSGEHSLVVPVAGQKRSMRDSSGSLGGCSSTNGSEPDLASLGLNDGDQDGDGTGMQIDVSDWLDVIMPSTGLTPLSTNAPVSFSADPILTPKTQQEVLDLFNFDDGEFTTPSEPGSTFLWDKLAEPSTSSS